MDLLAVPPHRRVRGENVWTHMLTWDQVREMREIYCERCSAGRERGAKAYLAKLYNVSFDTTSRVIKRTSWKPEFDPKNRPPRVQTIIVS